ncbi:S1C family serine protease [Cellulomonas rhizosphaerae]|uniref:PDZ domain-containing protein n=1 Tax=Cellulomonas rhizosphaerae TaxID=2293719 RepID=A0A413RNU4_9CELL|nr:trypsin-like peptidase domain-containing protein [Cellulomonas rhizosphaerae]RHA43686.1 PDZ domain-containing protein [Cellulomonas rhizosphaerae]
MTTPENEHPQAAPTQPIPPVAHPTNPFTPPHPAAPADQRALYEAAQREAAQREAADRAAAAQAAAAQAHTTPIAQAAPHTAPIAYAGTPYAAQQAPQQPVTPWFGEQQTAVATAPARTKKRSAWLPITSAAAVGALVAGIAVYGISQDDGDNGGTSAASLATIGRSSNDTVPVSGSTSDDPDWQKVSAAVQASVVAITVTTADGSAQGSGVIIDDSGHIVTNNHVVSGAQGKVSVTLTDGRILQATVVGTDPTTDLAVIKLDDAPSGLVPAAIGDSAAVVVGEPVMAVGNPLGLANTVTTGIVSAVDRPVSTQGENGGEGTVTNAIQVDAAVNPGNSGGPLFDAQGRVIGINSSIATLSSESGSIGLGFAIPSNLVKNVAAQLISSGTAKHAFLGVTLNDGTATADGVTRAGAVVESVSDGSPAAAAKLVKGDVVVAINDKPVGGAESLTAYVRSLASGDDAKLTIVRDGKAIDVTVTLATREDTTSSQSTPDQTTPGDGSDQGTLPGDGSGQLPGDGSDQGTQPGDGSGQATPGDGSDLGSLTPEQLYKWFQEHQGDLGGSSDQGGQG